MIKAVQYRPMSTRTDLRELVRLIRTELMPLSYSVHPDDEAVIRTLPERFREGHTIVAALAKRRDPVGFVHFQNVQGMLHIDMLVVHPDCQNARIGRTLMDRAEASGKKMGCLVSLLYVDDVNERAHRFYKRCGYEPVRHHPSLKVTQYTKPL